MCFGVSAPVLFFYLSDHLRMSSTKLSEHNGSMAQAVLELTTLNVFLGVVRFEVVNKLASSDMAHIGGIEVVLFSVLEGMIRRLFMLSIFRVFRRKHYDSILALPAIAPLVEV